MNSHIVGQMEALSGRKMNEKEKEYIVHGADEVDLVYSGLEETMVNATHEIMNELKNNPAIPDSGAKKKKKKIFFFFFFMAK